MIKDYFKNLYSVSHQITAEFEENCLFFGSYSYRGYVTSGERI